MKTRFAKYFALLALTLFASTPAHAWWFANAQVIVNPLEVNAMIYNGLPGPIHCQGRVLGTTWNGFVAAAAVNTIIYPGQHAYAFAYTNPANPFINGWSEIWCR